MASEHTIISQLKQLARAWTFWIGFHCPVEVGFFLSGKLLNDDLLTGYLKIENEHPPLTNPQAVCSR